MRGWIGWATSWRMRRARTETTFSSKKLYSNNPPGNIQDIITEGKRSVISNLEVRIDFLMFFYIHICILCWNGLWKKSYLGFHLAIKCPTRQQFYVNHFAYCTPPTNTQNCDLNVVTNYLKLEHRSPGVVFVELLHWSIGLWDRLATLSLFH